MIDWTKKLSIALGDYPEDKDSFIATSGKREDYLELLEAEHKAGYDGFCISMPCGYHRWFITEKDIPQEDLPCPCGKGFLIKLD